MAQSTVKAALLATMLPSKVNIALARAGLAAQWPAIMAVRYGGKIHLVNSSQVTEGEV